jgi:hypothetical protein
VVCDEHGIGGGDEYCGDGAQLGRIHVCLALTQTRTEGRSPLRGSEFTTKAAILNFGFFEVLSRGSTEIL